MKNYISGLLLIFILAVSCLSRPQSTSPISEEIYKRQREEMVAFQLASRDIRSPRVLEVMRTVPRHRFVPAEVRQYVYGDSPVPIGANQTISQPYIVALMTQTVDPQPQHRALEIGTGSGYQAAVLAEFVKEVYTIEIIPTLAEGAKNVLAELGYKNVFVRQGDGYKGWPEKAPFDIIMVTAAAEKIPEPLLEQLAEDGKLVMPVGDIFDAQVLTLATKKKGKIKKSSITGVRFVPMTGEAQRKKNGKR